MIKALSQRAVVLTRAAIVVTLLVIALIIFQVLVSTSPIVPTVDPDKLLQRVNTFTAAPVPVRRQWIGYGTAEAIDSADIPARVTATVTRVRPEALEGTPVTQDQVLVELDDSDYVNQLNIAQQNLAGVVARIAELDNLEDSLKQQLVVQTRDMELARDELTRIKEMFKRDAANQKGVDAADRAALTSERNKLRVDETLAAIGPRRSQLLAEKLSLTSSIDIAERNLERCTIRSPIDGVIQFVDVEVGENLTLGQRVARVVNLERIQTPLSLSASARSHIRVGDQVRLTSTADPGLSWDGQVTRVSPEDDPATRTFAAYVEITHSQLDSQDRTPDQQTTPAPLAPGVFVSGVVMEADPSLRIVVPRRSIRTQRVMLIRDGLIYSSKVTEGFAFEGHLPKLGVPDDQWAVIVDGVDDGDQVVLNPTRSLSDGQPVQPVPARVDRTAGAGGTP
jgi:RND family efflux transporter MFP subunit